MGKTRDLFKKIRDTKEMGIPGHLTCLLRNPYADQEATVRTEHGTRLVPNWERSISRLDIVTLVRISVYMPPYTFIHCSLFKKFLILNFLN